MQISAYGSQSDIAILLWLQLGVEPTTVQTRIRTLPDNTGESLRPASLLASTAARVDSFLGQLGPTDSDHAATAARCVARLAMGTIEYAPHTTRAPLGALVLSTHSHSIVAGGFPEMS